MKKNNEKGFRKLNTKLVISYLVLSFCIIFLLNIVMYFMIGKETYKDYVSASKREIIQIDNGINRYIKTLEQNIKMFSQSELLKGVNSKITSYINLKGINGKIPMEPLKKDPYEGEIYKRFDNFLKAHEDVKSVFVGVAENGGYVQCPAEDRKEGYDARKRGWYELALQNSGQVIIDKAGKTSTGELSINLISTIQDDSNKIKGVFGLDISLKGLTDIIKKMKVGKNGFVILTDKYGKILANPKDENSVLKNIKDINVKGLEKVYKLQGKEEKIKFIDGKEYIVGVHKSQNNKLDWNYIFFIDNNELLSGAKKIGSINAVLGIIFMAICVFVAGILGKKISKPIVSLAESIKIIGTGDFSKEIDEKNLKIKDEIGEMAISTETMRGKVSDMLIDVKKGFNSVQDGTKDLSKASIQMAQASTEVASTIQEVAKSVINQAEELSSVSFITEEAKKQLTEMNKFLNEISNKSKNIDDFANESNVDMMELAKTVEKIKNVFGSFLNKVKNLDNQINKIEEITSLINSISGQTNLLALNAAIEAARAGEAGKGFAVVAGEVRKLSEQTKESADNINVLIKNIVQETTNILSTSNNLDKELNNQGIVIEKSLSSFEAIITSVGDIVPMIDNLEQTVEKINSKNEEVVSSIESVSASAQQVSASTEEISASAEEMNATAEQVSETSQKLNKLTNAVMDKVNVFKLK
ncbi:methyl-accepting chemotaxis protein [Hathewaya limosa]|uniref:Methyl-accepting chemotaxis protein n=1 Tax=Hathewaya limosa TaxID=1536 RepID=A0ABU0JU00_HATLI|nr:methyl-accepting chemotaxis protein [Hathewaya limosa]MDQ0480570.1 methyl-accepting chemotaxis protein [Hathewaya limosa]